MSGRAMNIPLSYILQLMNKSYSANYWALSNFQSNFFFIGVSLKKQIWGQKLSQVSDYSNLTVSSPY